MFTFLNSALAWTLLAAAIPLLIHLFTRKKLKKVPFSSLKFLQEMQKKKIRQLKIRQLILMLLRTLIILLLISAFLRPTVKSSNFIAGQQARTSVVLVIDNSLSMGLTQRGQSGLSTAKLRALELLRLLQPEDEVSLITAAYPARQLTGQQGVRPAEAMTLLERIEQTAGNTDIEGALALAAERLSQSVNLNKEIYLFTDQRFAINAPKATALVDPAIRVFLLPIERGNQRNLALTDMRVRNQIFELRKPVEVEVAVTNTGVVDEAGRMVYLMLGNRRVAQSQVDVPAGEERRVILRVVPESPGYQLLTAEIENDALLLDNRRYGLFYLQNRLGVLLVGGQAEDRRYLRLALEPAIRDSSMVVRELDFEQWRRQSLNPEDVLVFVNVPQIDAATQQRLERHFASGGGAVFFMGTNVDLRNYNERLFQHFALGSLGGGVGSLTNHSAVLRIDNVQLDHPIFEGVFPEIDNGLPFETPQFHFAVTARPDARTGVVMQYSNGAPFLLSRRVERGELLVFLTAADASWSDFVFKGIFAPLVYRSIRYAAGQGSLPGQQLFAGRQGSAVLNTDGLGELQVMTPQRVSERVRPKIIDGRYTVVLDAPMGTGFYRLTTGQEDQFIWAVNFDPEEISLPPMPSQRIAEFLGEEHFILLPNDGALAPALQNWRLGRELWKLFASLALAGLIAEMLIYRTPNEPS